MRSLYFSLPASFFFLNVIYFFEVSFLTQVAHGSEEFVDSHNGKALNPFASALLEMQVRSLNKASEAGLRKTGMW